MASRQPQGSLFNPEWGELPERDCQPHLTPQERLILAEIVGGKSSKEVARGLNISPRTVEYHRSNLLKKYGAKNTAELVRKVLS
jgi:DNA-binding CsgD family transcriptional regulator